MNIHTAKFIIETNNAKKLQVDGNPTHRVFNMIFITNANAQENIINIPGDVAFPKINAFSKGCGNFIYIYNYIRKYLGFQNN